MLVFVLSLVLFINAYSTALYDGYVLSIGIERRNTMTVKHLITGHTLTIINTTVKPMSYRVCDINSQYIVISVIAGFVSAKPLVSSSRL